jgi:hypothetical protein
MIMSKPLTRRPAVLFYVHTNQPKDITMTTQIRGNCQCCGRDQAVVRGNMAKHGYTVDDGYFNGVCSGHRYAPLQLDRSITDQMILRVTNDAVHFDALAADYREGREHPTMVKVASWPKHHSKSSENFKLYADVSPGLQAQACREAAYHAQSRAQAARSWVKDMAALADKTHGTALREIELAEGPAPIREGEQRNHAKAGILTVRYTEKGRVYWHDSRGYRGWDGVQSWRKYPLA